MSAATKTSSSKPTNPPRPSPSAPVPKAVRRAISQTSPTLVPPPFGHGSATPKSANAFVAGVPLQSRSEHLPTPALLPLALRSQISDLKFRHLQTPVPQALTSHSPKFALNTLTLPLRPEQTPGIL